LPINSKGIAGFKLGKITYVNVHKNCPTEIIYEAGLIRLGVESRFRFLINDNGRYSDYEKRQSGGSRYALGTKWKYDEVYRKRNLFFIIDENGKVYQATRSNILFNYPGHKDDILKFIYDNKTNFKSGQDLTKLLSFISSKIERGVRLSSKGGYAPCTPCLALREHGTANLRVSSMLQFVYPFRKYSW